MEFDSKARTHWHKWAGEIEERFNDFSSVFAKGSDLWWLSDASRLNLLPWGNGADLEPLLQTCSKSGVSLETLLKSSAPNFLSGDSPDIWSDLEAEVELGQDTGQTVLVSRSGFKALLGLMREIYRAGKAVWVLFHEHVRAPRPTAEAVDLAIFCESICGDCNKGVENFFGDIHRYIDRDLLPGKTRTFCSSVRQPKSLGGSEVRDDGPTIHWLLDGLKIQDLVVSVLLTAYFAIKSFRTCRSEAQKARGNPISSLTLWFIKKNVHLNRVLINICLFRAAFRLLADCRPSAILIQYEEKPTERAIISASRKVGAKVFGYVCHPMSRALVALRDVDQDGRPRPDRYGVCGPAVRELLCDWARKSHLDVTVWGSGKQGRPVPRSPFKSSESFSMLLLLSHPDELRFFHEWLIAEPRIVDGIQLTVRRYAPVGKDPFTRVFEKLKADFDSINEASGTLSEAFGNVDLAVYSQTSAGLLAGRHGTLAASIDLSGIIPISPCIDPSGPPLSCDGAVALAELIEFLRLATEDELDRVYTDQAEYEDRIFAAIEKEQISKDLSWMYTCK